MRNEMVNSRKSFLSRTQSCWMSPSNLRTRGPRPSHLIGEGGLWRTCDVLRHHARFVRLPCFHPRSHLPTGDNFIPPAPGSSFDDARCSSLRRENAELLVNVPLRYEDQNAIAEDLNAIAEDQNAIAESLTALEEGYSTIAERTTALYEQIAALEKSDAALIEKYSDLKNRIKITLERDEQQQTIVKMANLWSMFTFYSFPKEAGKSWSAFRQCVR